jgi:hypothetical protein
MAGKTYNNLSIICLHFEPRHAERARTNYCNVSSTSCFLFRSDSSDVEHTTENNFLLTSPQVYDARHVCLFACVSHYAVTFGYLFHVGLSNGEVLCFLRGRN